MVQDQTNRKGSEFPLWDLNRTVYLWTKDMLKYQLWPLQTVAKGHTHRLQNWSIKIPNPLQKCGVVCPNSKAEEARNNETHTALLRGFSLRMLDIRQLCPLSRSGLCNVWDKKLHWFLVRGLTLKKLLGCIRAVPSQWSGTNHILQTPSLCSVHRSTHTEGIYNRSKVFLPLVLQCTLFTNLFLSVWTPCYAWQHERFFCI